MSQGGSHLRRAVLPTLGRNPHLSKRRVKRWNGRYSEVDNDVESEKWMCGVIEAGGPQVHCKFTLPYTVRVKDQISLWTVTVESHLIRRMIPLIIYVTQNSKLLPNYLNSSWTPVKTSVYLPVYVLISTLTEVFLFNVKKIDLNFTDTNKLL